MQSITKEMIVVVDSPIRLKREMSLKERGDQCKAMELSQKSFGLFSDILDSIGSIPIIGDVVGTVTAGVSIVTKVTSGGLDIAQTALDCSAVPFDEIKEIMDKKFSEVDRKLDQHSAALEAVSNLVGETLSSVESTRKEMNVRFDEVLMSIEDSQVKPIVSKINNIAQYFDSERDRISGLNKEDYIRKLKEPNSILLYFKESRTPEGLHAPLFNIINHGYAIPDSINDKIAFDALYALLYGTQTYISIMYFLLKQYTYLANYHYQNGEIDEYNEYFGYIINIFKDFKSSLVGSGSAKSIPLIGKVIDVLNTVTNKGFLRLERGELVQTLNNRIVAFKEVKKNIDDMELPIITETPENYQHISFDQNIRTPIGEWEKGSDVRYALQYISGDIYSNVGEWSKPTKIKRKACPTLKLSVDPLRKTRLLFRKFNDDTPQLAGVIDPYDTAFTDIDRDLYNAAEMPDRETGLKETQILISNNARFNATFEKGRQALHAAASSGNVKIVMHVTLSGIPIDINARDKSGKTPLHIATDVGRAGFVKFLIERNAMINAKTELEEDTPLHLAARRGFVKTVKKLLQSSEIHLNDKNKSGFTPLHNAVLGGKNMVDILISQNGIDINPRSKTEWTPFHLAAINNDLLVAKTLMKSNEVEVNASDSSSMTPLHHAAMLGHLEMTQYLMTLSGLNINAVTDVKWTPLHYATFFKKDLVALELLNSLDIDKNFKSEGGITPLHFAVTSERSSIVSKLLDMKVNIEDQTTEGYTALHLAAMRTDPDIISLLIDNNAKIEAKTSNGSTPLHMASSTGMTNAVLALLNNRADLRSSDNDGQTPLHLAALNDHLEVARAIIERDSSVIEMRNKDSETPLNAAAQKLHREMIKDLLKKGADINTQNKDGTSPLLRFAEAGDLDMVKYLINKGADAYIADNNGMNFFYFAIQNGHKKIVEYGMGEKKFDWSKIDGQRKCPGSCSIANFVGCDANEYIRSDMEEYLVSTHNRNICEPLYTAARNGKLDIVKYLLEEKAMKVDGVALNSNEINTPLCEATAGGHVAVVKYLVGKNADVNKPCRRYTALNQAIVNHHMELVKFLSTHGAKVGDKDDNGNTPLHYALKYFNYEAAEYLVEEHGADINAKDRDGNTALSIVIDNDYRMDMVEYFVEKGADLTSTNLREKTALDIAEDQYSSEIVEYLQSKINRFLRKIDFRDNEYNLPYSNLGINSMTNKEIGRDDGKYMNEDGESSKMTKQTIDVTGTLLLLDIMIRYFTNQKYINTTYGSVSDADALAASLRITEKFEDMLKFFTSIPPGEQVDLAKVHSNVYKAIKSGKNGHIHEILCSYVKAFSSLKPEEMEKLLSAFMATRPFINIRDSSDLKGQAYENLQYLLTQYCLGSDGNPGLLRI